MYIIKIENTLFSISKILILAIFFSYWISTLIYCSPNNFIRIQLNKYESMFGSVFYQRWTFFTPPPKVNERVYLLFINKYPEQNVISCEIFNAIRKNKRKNPIMNTTYEAIDGILTGSTYALNNSVSDRLTILRKTNPDSSESFFQKELNSMFINQNNRSTYFKTMINYANEIARINKINVKNYYLKIRMVTIEIPPFKDRFNKKYIPKRKVVFETCPISF